MGLLDRLKPAPLLRSGPLLLLPSGTSPESVDALVAAWAPLRRRTGEGWELVDGVRWEGPIEVALADVTEHDLPGGYPIAYVARARRSRGDGLVDRLVGRAVSGGVERRVQAMVDEAIAAGDVTAEELAAARAESDARIARDYPQGEPELAELDAWHLVCGLARRLRGTCRLVDGRFFVPDLVDAADPVLYGRTRLDPTEVAAIVAPLLGLLTTVEEPEDDDDDWTIASGRGRDAVSVDASLWMRDLDERIAGLDPLAAYDGLGGRPVEYLFSGPDSAQADLLRACALLAPHVEGIVLDEEGFPVD